jgi:hypothetical protein
MRLMPPRILSILVAALAGIAGATAAWAADPLPEPTKTSPAGPNDALMAPIEFYLAHGEADACGPGCNEWIVAEGKIDVAAPNRLRLLLAKLGGRQPTIYFHSPGGSVNGSLALGKLIRDRKLQVSVAHTVPLDCNREKAPDAACDAKKRSGQPIEAVFDPTIAMCNSGCVYALIGGAVRIVPPWVKLGVHDAGLDPKASLPTGTSLEATMWMTHLRVQAYLRDMGIDAALLPVIFATPFEKLRPLQRDELVRFGIDTRDFGETGWQFVDKPKPAIRKQFFVSTDNDQQHYVDGLLSIDCGSSLGRTRHLAFARQLFASDPDSSGAVSMSVNDKKIDLYAVGNLNFHVRQAFVAQSLLDTFGDDAMIELPATELGRKAGLDRNVELSMAGFSAADAKLRKACAEGPPNAQIALPAQLPNQVGTAKLIGTPFPSAATAQTQTVPAANAPVTSAPASPSAAPKVEVTRVAAAEQKLRLDFFSSVEPDCSSMGQMTVRIVEQPQHGALAVENGQAFTNYPKDNQRYDCNTRKSDGTLVFYQAKSDYRGPDSVTLYVITPLGAAFTRHYSIDVK